LDGAPGLDCRDRCVDILGIDVTTVHHAAGHVFAMTRVALGHAGRLESAVGGLGHRELLEVSLSANTTGAHDGSMKWILGYGTRFVKNTVVSTFRALSKRRDAVREDTTCMECTLLLETK